MYTFVFTYTDQNKLTCAHVKSVADSNGTISEQNLSTHKFSLSKDLWLFTENGSFCVSHHDLRCIEVTME